MDTLQALHKVLQSTLPDPTNLAPVLPELVTALKKAKKYVGWSAGHGVNTEYKFLEDVGVVPYIEDTLSAITAVREARPKARNSDEWSAVYRDLSCGLLHQLNQYETWVTVTFRKQVIALTMDYLVALDCSRDTKVAAMSAIHANMYPMPVVYDYFLPEPVYSVPTLSSLAGAYILRSAGVYRYIYLGTTTTPLS